jgi:hypothetical protein
LFGRLSGASDDWAKGNATIKYAYTMELAPGDGTPDASFGFTLPEVYTFFSYLIIYKQKILFYLLFKNR